MTTEQVWFYGDKNRIQLTVEFVEITQNPACILQALSSEWKAAQRIYAAVASTAASVGGRVWMNKEPGQYLILKFLRKGREHAVHLHSSYELTSEWSEFWLFEA